MSMTVTIKITGAREAISRLRRLEGDLKNFSLAMKQIGKEVARYFANEAMASQGGVFGNRWDRLSPTYARWKAKHYPGRPPLVLRGTMQHLFDSTSNTNSATITNLAPHFKYHQSTEARHKLPRRPLIGINSDVKSIVKSIIEADVQTKLRRAS